MGWMTLLKVKAIPVQATTDNRHLKVVGLLAKCTGRLYPQEISLVLFSVTRLSRSQGHSMAERFKDKEKSLWRHRPSLSTMPQPTARP